MVAADVKQIRGRDLDRIRNEGLAHHRRLRSGYGRFQQHLIANTSCATVGSEHFAVNRFDGFERQMLERLAQERRLKSAAFFLIKRLAVVAAVSESIARPRLSDCGNCSSAPKSQKDKGKIKKFPLIA